MQKVTLIIRKNQNNVTVSEIAKIKRNIRKQFAEKVRFTTLANNAADNVINKFTGDVDMQGAFIVIETSDVNYTFSADVYYATPDVRNHVGDFSISWKS
jgi:hypothetical protein